MFVAGAAGNEANIKTKDANDSVNEKGTLIPVKIRVPRRSALKSSVPRGAPLAPQKRAAAEKENRFPYPSDIPSGTKDLFDLR